MAATLRLPRRPAVEAQDLAEGADPEAPAREAESRELDLLRRAVEAGGRRVLGAVHDPPVLDVEDAEHARHAALVRVTGRRAAEEDLHGANQ